MLAQGDTVAASSARTDTNGPARRAARPASVRRAVLAIAPTILAIGAWSHRWSSDDGFINYRIIDQLFAGNGLVFNAGERVEAGTSPLWLGILALGRAAVGWWVDIGWIAVALGIALSVVGIVAAQLGARRLWADRDPAVVVPAGALVLACLPVMWDFATSGLETGLWFAWLGTSFGLVARRAMGDGAGSRIERWSPVVLGLGPLVRPDFALYSVAFVGAWSALSWRGWRAATGVLATALAVPVAYQVFRMGYFGALVPTTALAKEAGRAEWARGATYVADFATATLVAVPLVAAIVLGVGAWHRARGESGRPMVVCGALVGAAVVHLVYLLRVGGDFMHGRFLLAPLFVLLLPIAVVVVPRTWVTAVAYGVLAVWCVASAGVLRVPYDGISADGIANERGFWSGLAGVEHPVTADDYASSYAAVIGRSLAARERAGEDVILRGSDDVIGRPPPGAGVFEADTSIGVLGSTAGTDVHIVDVIGLADPVAARIEDVTADGRTGHRKHLADVWILAEHGVPGGPSGSVDPDDLAAARRALACGAAADMRAATTEPMSVSRFLRNLVTSFDATRLRIPADPREADARLCG